MSSFISEIRSFIHTHQLILPNEYVLAAVSGGIDSMVMLHCFLVLKDEIPFRLSVLHVNHGVRGADSDQDEAMVRKFCGQHKLTLITERLEGLTAASTEEELRDARYDVFARTVEAQKADRLATGHHLQDQLETFLMRLAGGASIRGLAGIPVRREYLIRPLLGCRKADVDTYAEAHGVPFRVDRTNYGTDRLRNRIRHQLLPVMTDVLGPGLEAGYRKSAGELRSIYKSYREYVRTIFHSVSRTEGERISISLNQFVDLDRILRRHIIEYCIYSFYNLYSDLDVHKFDAFETFLTSSRTGGRFRISGNIQVEKDRDRLIVYPLRESASCRFRLHPGEKVRMGRNIIGMKAVSPREIMWSNSRRVEYICGDRLELPLVVRTWHRGDRFIPLGLKGEQKVSDFFINRKVPRVDKETVPLVCNGSEIVWIAGFQLDDRYKVAEECDTVYQLTLDKEVR